MTDTPRCAGCGAKLLQDASPQGLCAPCLLRLGLSSTSIPSTEPDEPSTSPLQPPPRRDSTWTWKGGLCVAAGFVIALGLVFVLLHTTWPSSSQPNVIRFTVSLSHPTDFAMSPDGRRLAFTARSNEGKTLLWIRPLDSFMETPLADTENAAAPFWSPDSRYIGFFALGKLRKIDVGNGISEVICDAPTGKGGTWGIRGTIVFARESTGPLYRVSDRGGTPQVATHVDQSDRLERTNRWPYFLPDGRHFIYTATAHNSEKDAVFVASIEDEAVQEIMKGSSRVVQAQEFLMFVRNGLLLMQPFDSRSLRTRGEARPLRFAERINRFSTSTNGILAYEKAEQILRSPPTWFDRSGKALGVVEKLTGAEEFSLSPDGRVVAASQSGDLWLADLGRGVLSRFTFDHSEDRFPIWSPDGSRIAFLANRNGRRAIYQRPANGATKEESILEVPRLESVESFSPDGRFLIYTSREDKGKFVSWVVSLMGGDRKPMPIPSAFDLREPRFSPDGRWLAYVSNESGKDEVYIETFPPGEAKWQVSANGGTTPRWSRDGRTLFYISPENILMRVPIGVAGASLQLGIAEGLFRAVPGSYEVSSDGRFLMMPPPPEEQSSSPLNIVINWPSEVQR